jgi:DNA-binding MarR family transcriptional regulator
MQECASKALAQFDLTFAQWLALRHLADGAAVTSSELGRVLHRDAGSITRIVDHHERLGWVRRRRVSKDRRIVRLDMTATGRRMLARDDPRVAAVLEEYPRNLSDADRRDLVVQLEKFFDVHWIAGFKH